MNDHVRSEDLAAYVDGRLNAGRKSELESHFSRCPACLDELADVSAVMGGREKVPARFLEQALGIKAGPAPTPLRLRLVFEVAAAVMVVVFIGYFFLSGNRFWQAPEQEKPARPMEEKTRRLDGQPVARDRQAVPPPAPQDERDAKGLSLSDSLASEKSKISAVDKDMPAPVVVKANAPQQGLPGNATEPAASGDAHMAFAAKSAPAAKVTPAKGGAAEQKLEPQQDPGAGTALSRMADAKEARLDEEVSANNAAAAVPADPAAGRPEDAKKMRNAVMQQKETAEMGSLSHLLFEGEVGWPDLQNPELIVSWTWFRPGLALELRIDGAGAVFAASAHGTADPALVKLGEAEARKLLFSASKKKTRRVRLVAKGPPLT